eukprot:TRINITY_DN377_c0_g1_i1.p1 TRINITY_DN377_c0_g1~~TRINITY_DN377_c0_g1_i1.p1  ORF type:complete len:216 (+),score=39.18 TRINITY_DN377_c0_g1_i1:24-650(+)
MRFPNWTFPALTVLTLVLSGLLLIVSVSVQTWESAERVETAVTYKWEFGLLQQCWEKTQNLQTTNACKKYKDILQYYDPCGGVVSDSFYITMGQARASVHTMLIFAIVFVSIGFVASLINMYKVFHKVMNFLPLICVILGFLLSLIALISFNSNHHLVVTDNKFSTCYKHPELGKGFTFNVIGCIFAGLGIVFSFLKMFCKASVTIEI